MLMRRLRRKPEQPAHHPVGGLVIVAYKPFSQAITGEAGIV